MRKIPGFVDFESGFLGESGVPDGIDWMNVGRQVYGSDRKMIEAAVAAMVWVDHVPGTRYPMGPGMAVSAFLKEFRLKIPKRVSVDGVPVKTPGSHPEDGNWTLLGVQVTYKDGPRRIVFADGGSELVTVCSYPVKD